MTTVHRRAVSAVAAAGLVAMAALCLSGASVRAESAASSAAVATQGPRPASAAQPEALAAKRGTGSDEGRIVLIAIAVGAVGAFTVLQVLAWSRYRRAQARPDARTRPAVRGPGPRAGQGDAASADQAAWARERGYGSWPGYGRGARPWGAARKDRPRDWSS